MFVSGVEDTRPRDPERLRVSWGLLGGGSDEREYSLDITEAGEKVFLPLPDMDITTIRFNMYNTKSNIMAVTQIALMGPAGQ